MCATRQMAFAVAAVAAAVLQPNTLCEALTALPSHL
jgi:hypothetical protein